MMPRSHFKQRAILGGTFNPVHWGHLLTAQKVLSEFELDQIIWVPAAHPPHKSSSSLLDFGHRLEMLHRAIADYPEFTLCGSDSAQTSYAVSTFIDLQKCYPNTNWFWIVGFDTFVKLPQWYEREQFIFAVQWLVAPRLLQGCLMDIATVKSRTESLCQQIAQQISHPSFLLQWQVISMPIVDISSSLIRQYCQQGRSINEFVPESVRVYIEQESLYQA